MRKRSGKRLKVRYEGTSRIFLETWLDPKVTTETPRDQQFLLVYVKA